MVELRTVLQSRPLLAGGRELLPLAPQELPGGQHSWGGFQWASDPPGSQGVSLCVLQMLPLSLALVRGSPLVQINIFPSLCILVLCVSLPRNKIALPSLLISNNNPNNTSHISRSFHLRK